jgi:NAD(P)-dependent dehydrogenase (short-subunit alcohol dehydrogenase family)
MPLKGKTILITGSARRIGREFALAAASAGANVIIHHGHSPDEAELTAHEIRSLGSQCWILEGDLENPTQAMELVDRAWKISPLFALVNSAAIFENLTFSQTTYANWQLHLAVNLTAPFLLSQSFSRLLPREAEGRIINILDWRALRPGSDHFPYTISKAALAALTKSLATALGPNIAVNGLALGAILPPSDGRAPDILNLIPARRWAKVEELRQAFLFLLEGPAYITGEILYLDGGRHLI